MTKTAMPIIIYSKILCYFIENIADATGSVGVTTAGDRITLKMRSYNVAYLSSHIVKYGYRIL